VSEESGAVVEVDVREPVRGGDPADVEVDNRGRPNRSFWAELGLAEVTTTLGAAWRALRSSQSTVVAAPTLDEDIAVMKRRLRARIGSCAVVRLCVHHLHGYDYKRTVVRKQTLILATMAIHCRLGSPDGVWRARMGSASPTALDFSDAAGLKDHDTAGDGTCLHRREPLVDLVEGDLCRHKLVELEPSLQIQIGKHRDIALEVI